MRGRSAEKWKFGELEFAFWSHSGSGLVGLFSKELPGEEQDMDNYKLIQSVGRGE